MQTQMKKTKAEIEAMTSRELSDYIIEITQTPICSDKEYCEMLTKAHLKKPIIC